jgi:hypothetical protein
MVRRVFDGSKRHPSKADFGVDLLGRRQSSMPRDIAMRLLLDFLDGGKRSTAAAWERQ